MPARVTGTGLDQLAVNTIKMLAVDAVEKAKSGHPGMPMGAADYTYVLWTRFLRYNPQDPAWPDRDRFVLSAGHGCMLLYAMLHLAGFDMPMEEIRNFRQWGSRTPGHPEHGLAPGIETTTGPLGQGFGNAVGIALASKMLAARVNTEDFAPITHRVFTIVSDGDLMEGVASEAASIAGHLRLGNIVSIYDDNHITIEGKTDLAFSEDVGRRFEAYGWHVQRIDGHDRAAAAEALAEAVAETGRPSLIVARTHIAAGAPTKHDSAEAHGNPLGPEEATATKRALGWPEEPKFLVPDEVRERFAARAAELRPIYDAWQRGFEGWRSRHPDLAPLWDQLRPSRMLPANLASTLLESAPREAAATRAHSGKIIQKLASLVPALAGGAGDLAPSTSTLIKDSPSVAPGSFIGRNLHFGIREHAMGAIVNGMAVDGSFIPYGATFLVFSDYMRPAIRLAALSRFPSIFVFTHDSVFLGEDGPTHQPIEHLTALRAIVNLVVIRPCDGIETALAWAFAVGRRDGPTALVFTRQTVPVVERAAPPTTDLVARGAYVLLEAGGGKPKLVIIATGSEVPLAAEARAILEKDGTPTRVVSMPSMELFLGQSDEYQTSVVPQDGTPLVVVEAGLPDCWHRIVGREGLIIGLRRYGASAPYKVIAEKLGFTGPQVAARIAAWLQDRKRRS
ncbi:MAG: transketolase [Acidobacteria bacterium]|nr:MAG: transketolase [Acidobacteriota bacterium]